ncbi:MAG: nucleoside triphosphate pyrophosphohydrolase [Spirochaetia bacterium]|nr:nucleoside triphosphate pyrophosphohydrolase [Spirochaetia bacterium]
MEELNRLRETTARLREPGGCDWDRAQDKMSMRPHLLEESYEVIDAVDKGSTEGLREELGDLLFLVFFYARLAEEAGEFTINDVAQGISDKLVRRHPHVFGGAHVDGVKEILSNWEKIKAGEKKDAAHAYEFLPELFRAHKLQEKASRQGLDWPDVTGVFDKLREELAELEAEVRKSPPKGKDAAPAAGIEEELGDLLFTVVNASRHLAVNPEVALRRAVTKFQTRFEYVRAKAEKEGRPLTERSAEELDDLWNESKKV